MASAGRTWTVDSYKQSRKGTRVRSEIGGDSGHTTSSQTYVAPETSRLKTCTVPLSLQTHNSCSSGRKATPYISALSDPRLNSRTCLPVTAFHTRTRVPRADVVASRLPDGGMDSVASAELCAMMMETGCFDGGGGSLRTGDEGGGLVAAGRGQGGK